MTVRATRLAVIPAYNEQASMARVIDSLNEYVPDFDTLVVDDGQTKVLAQRLGLVEQRLGEADRRRDRRRHIEAEAENGSTVEPFAEVRE
jgi:cellulose synthase/poly-beta-1,6-N-acetylglucosamine synthase-like glycosyltransferase